TYIRAAQRVLRLVSTPHGDGPGYELDTRLRPSGSHGLLVVSLEAFARYHGLRDDGAPLEGALPEAHDWERQALVKARPCAGDACGYLDGGTAAVLREGYAMLRRLEQALRVVHGTSASLIEQGAPGLPALARRMGFRDPAAEALLERYLAVTRDVRAAYVTV